MNENRRVLIVSAGQKNKSLENMSKKAIEILENESTEYLNIDIPSAVNAPTILRCATRSMELKSSETRYIGYIILGSITKEDTELFETTKDFLAEQTIRGIQEITTQFSLAYSVAITLDEEDKNADQKGEQAARNCINMLSIKKQMGL